MHKALVLSPGTEGNGKVGDTFILSSETIDDSGVGEFSLLVILFKTWNVEIEKILEVKKVCIVMTFSYKKKF